MEQQNNITGDLKTESIDRMIDYVGSAIMVLCDRVENHEHEHSDYPRMYTDMVSLENLYVRLQQHRTRLAA